MATRIVAAALVLVLAGCASTPGGTVPQGNFLPKTTEQQRLADDALRQIQALYPPARTRLVLAQPVADSFGAALLKGLRSAGYAVQEGAPGKVLDANGVLPLVYVVDPLGAGMVRVMVTVGGTSISRAYIDQAAAGPWVRKE